MVWHHFLSLAASSNPITMFLISENEVASILLNNIVFKGGNAANMDFLMCGLNYLSHQNFNINRRKSMLSITPETSDQLEYPLLGDRVQSTFIDTILILLLMFAIASILDKYENVPDWIRIVLFVSLWVVYEPLCMTFGATLGNYIKKIRVRQIADYSKRINLFQALIRYSVKVSLGWISFLTIHSNKKRRAIHDFASGSVMIKK